MPNPPVRIICFQSLAARGSVGLKAYAGILHDYWVPVPSLYLNGPGNMPGCRKFRAGAVEMLRSVIETEWEAGTRLVLVVGYIADEAQIRSLIHLLREYRERFESILIDPICGDNGQAYVEAGIIRAYPELLELGHVHFPNVTELQLISGLDNLDAALNWWKQRFPSAILVATGLIERSRIGIVYQSEGLTFRHDEKLREPPISGSGDLFLAKVAYLHFVVGKSLPKSVIQSAKFVENSMASTKLFT